MSAEKFAKLYDIEGIGQVLVQRRSMQDEAVIETVFLYGDSARCTLYTVFVGSDAEPERDRAFEAMTEEVVGALVLDTLKNAPSEAAAALRPAASNLH